MKTKMKLNREDARALVVAGWLVVVGTFAWEAHVFNKRSAEKTANDSAIAAGTAGVDEKLGRIAEALERAYPKKDTTSYWISPSSWTTINVSSTVFYGDGTNITYYRPTLREVLRDLWLAVRP